jgi:ribosomal protein S7
VPANSGSVEPIGIRVVWQPEGGAQAPGSSVDVSERRRHRTALQLVAFTAETRD